MTISNSASGELSLTAPTDPVKYMDYVFTRGDNRDWYLSALQESEMKVEATPEPSPTAAVTQDTQSMVESQLNSSMTDAASSTAGEEEAASDAAAPESSAEATTTTEETTEPSADSSSQEEPDASSDGDTASSDEAVG